MSPLDLFDDKSRSYRSEKETKEIRVLEKITNNLRDIIPEDKLIRIKNIALEEISKGSRDCFRAKVIDYKRSIYTNSTEQYLQQQHRLQKSIEIQEAKKELSISLCLSYRKGIPSWLRDKIIEVYNEDRLTLNYARRLCELADLFSGVRDSEYVAYLLDICGINRRYWT